MTSEGNQETTTGTSMMPRVRESLEVRRAGEKTYSVVAIERADLVIGRETGCTLCLADPMVSRRHARLYRDPFGRWWLRDLDSRNGTRVNDAKITEQLIGLGDVIEIGPFVLRMRRASSSDDSTVTMDAEPVSVVEVEDVRTTTLAEAGTPRVAASQLSTLMNFCRDLLGRESPRERLVALCRLMVGGEFQGRTALAMRVLRDRPDAAPQMLCEPQYAAEGERETPYISRGVLARLRRSAEPVLAGNAAPGPVDVELTLHRDVLPASAVACPLHVDEHTVDVLYVMLPPQYGTGEWLALVALAVEHFQQAEFAWAARRQA
ncbi:MAG TPA: FHA domain-containing protein, partial [Planctomycetota bacterium]|nr:FHA domain-containing protein [Planctomycetota bacterium]